MNNLGLFGWIRDGVKQSVLLGVSDALETIGTPDSANNQLHPALLSFAQQQPRSLNTTANAEAAPRIAGTASTGRKRLGRSLKDIDPAKPNG